MRFRVEQRVETLRHFKYSARGVGRSLWRRYGDDETGFAIVGGAIRLFIRLQRKPLLRSGEGSLGFVW